MKPLFCGTALALVIAVAAPAWAADPAAPPVSVPQPSASAPEAASPPVADNLADNLAGHLAIARTEPRRSRRSARREAASGLVKPGLWEFTAELQPADPPPYEAGKPVPDTPAQAAARTTYTSCIAAADAVPVRLGPQCKLDRSERQDARVTWWMSCPDRQVEAEGVALYAGDTMHATMISHLRGADGAVSDFMQNITGRHLGPCQLHAEMPPMPFSPGGPPSGPPGGPPSGPPNGAPNGLGAPSGLPGIAVPPSLPALAPSHAAAAQAGTTVPPAAASAPPPAPEQAAAPPPDGTEARRHHRHARGGHRGHRHAHRSSRRGWSASAGRAFGAAPNSGGGY